MSGGGSYAVSSRTIGEDRFYNPPAVRRQQQLQQRSSFESAETVTVIGSSALPMDLPVNETTTNLDRFIDSVTPSVLAHFVPQANLKSWRSREPEMQQLCYGLDDLWESFSEWSVYGVGVPVVLNGHQSVLQYYVPFLSGLQLYVDPLKTPSRCRRPGVVESSVQSSRETSGGSCYCEAERRYSDDAESGHSRGTLIFEFLERESPHNRKPLADKISALASDFPDLRKYKSCDLLPSSWLSVAWYPIYRIPVGPTLKDLDASFLTFHSLSSISTSNDQLRSHGASGRKTSGGVEGSIKVPLPVFGLASYKLKASILSPFGPLECQQESSLLEAAGTWLKNLQVVHPDYQFFRHHYSQPHRR